MPAWACKGNSPVKVYSQVGMKNDVNLHARSPRGGRGSFFPTSIRAISTYIRSVSANASNIASTVRSAAVLPISNGSLHEDERQREQVVDFLPCSNLDCLEGCDTHQITASIISAAHE